MSDTPRMKAILVLAAAIAFGSSPFWSDGFGGFDPKRFPDPQIDPPVQPAGYAFSIWGPIYLWLLAHAAFGLFRRADDAGWDAGRWPFFLSLAIGASWITVAQRNPLLATLLILIMLAGALMALLRTPSRDRWWLAGPLGLYAGWLTAASFVAIGFLGGGYDILFGEVAWAWIALLAALATVLAVQTRVPHAPEYGLAAAWAFVAVAVNNWGASLPLVAAALLAAALAAAYALSRLRSVARPA
jgi:hypothetical protein